MNNRIEVVAYDRPRKYWFSPDTGRLELQVESDQPTDLPPFGSVERALLFRGACKRFLAGGTLTHYRVGDTYYLQKRANRVELGDNSLSLYRRWFGPIGLFTVRHASLNSTFIDWRAGAMIQEAIDPT